MADSGRFVWYDLMTTDLDGARRFYSELFNWKFKEEDMTGAGKYNAIVVGDTGMGGMVPMEPSDGLPSHWIGYVTTDDVDAATTKASTLGGKIGREPFDIPKVGRMSVIVDPTGGMISPFKFAGDPAPEAAPAPGRFVWHELLTHDVESAKAFYVGVFGWKLGEMDMGDKGTYWLLKQGDKDAAGMMQMPTSAPAPSHWLFYVGVENVDETTDRAAALGATIMVPPTDIPKMGRFSVLTDPTGAPVATFQSAHG